MEKRLLGATVLLALCLSSADAQTVEVPLTPDRWDTLGVKQFVTETYLGKKCIVLNSGFISVKGADVRDGTIEADISFPEQRSFPGFAFRIKDLDNFENFYVRPHQSGNPDATQYTPVFNAQAGWQLYHGEGYSKAFTFKFNQWHHVKINLHGLQGEIYIDDMQTPLIKVTELLTGWHGGTFGLTSGGAPLRIASVRYAVRPGTAPAEIPVPATGTNGIITEWLVSNAVNRTLFGKKYELGPEIKDKLKWTRRSGESSGTINLAKFCKWSEDTNAVVARITIKSKSDQLKVLDFGFSDFVTAYLNDKALYAGADNFMSRDYRFLGTIGYFDKLFLPLKKGSNELWFVVSENFGGWGLKARFENMDNISLK